MIGLYFTLVLIVAAAIVAVESRNLLFSIIAFGLAGFGFSLSYIILGSWDLAIIQLGVEIFLLFYLVHSTRTVGEPETYPGRQLIAYLGTIAFVAIFLGFAFVIFRTLPAVNFSAAGGGLPGLYELIGVAAALFAAVIGALTILRPEGKQ
ncbi:MAG: DUF4040 domain-containing protein [Candidatus Margulisbacteria bacterium]|nr:DUF4040 domain-containing protein [Candidatus Margulisiibacteriota bacterium]